MTVLDYKVNYEIHLRKFKEKIKDQYLESVFPKSGDAVGIDLKSVHLKQPQDPEPLTVDIIRDLLRECGIDPLDITREYIIEGMSKNVFKKVRKKPDFLIESKDADVNGLLFEIEHLNKKLDKENDGEGIEQAREWYSVKPALFSHYDSIITNFIEWYFLRCNKEKEDFDPPRKMEPMEVLELIVDRRLGLGREYKTEDGVEKTKEITNMFYSGFQERLRKLLNISSKIKIDIEVQNFKKEVGDSKKEYESQLIRYYRTIFSRLLFIKILKSWKMINIDIIKIIFKGDKRHWGSDIRYLFFDVFNKPKKDRPKELPETFNNLDYLNGGLFRPSGIELDGNGNLRNVQLNPDAIKDIWDFFKGYKFLRSVSNGEEKSNNINPEILGYIFERSIGDERKMTGSYYTREEITNYMVENALYSLIIDRVNNYLAKKKIFPIKKITDVDFLENSEEIYYHILVNILNNLRICDPACGSGAFLEKLAVRLLYLYKKCYKGCGRSLPYILKTVMEKDSQMPFSDIYSVKKHIIQNNLYGVDINPSAIEICELRLWLWVVRPPEDTMFTSEKIRLLPLPNIEYNLRCGNSLIGYQRIRHEKGKRIDEVSFKEIFAKKNTLTNSYYLQEDLLSAFEKDNTRNLIDTIIDQTKSELNNLLLNDFRKDGIIIPATIIKILDNNKDSNFRKILHNKISEINKSCDLAKFKINLIEPSNFEETSIPGLLFTKERKTGKIKTIYTSSKFKFKYYSEYGDHPLSKFLLSLLPSWNVVRNIEFSKLIDTKDLEKVKPFHWNMEFSEVSGEDITKFEGFDIIIGNPPFIRIENIEKLLRELYKKNYLLAERRFDIYLLFYELSLKLLKKDGYLCFVSSNKFLKSQTAKNMREFLMSHFSIKEIVDFNNYNAFQGVNIKTLLIFLKKTKKKNIFPYVSINHKSFQLSPVSMNSIRASREIEQDTKDFSVYLIDEQTLSKEYWEFYPEIVKKIIGKLESPNSVKLLDLIKSNRQGVVTSANNIFIVSEETLNEYNIEQDFIYKIVKGEEIRRWQKIRWNDKYLIYPYRYKKGQIKREKVDFSKEKDLNLLKYLKNHKSELLQRYCVKSGNKDWFELHDPVSPDYFLEKKIMFPDISLVPSFSVDLTSNLFSLDTNYSMIPNDEKWLFYLMAILNSFVMEIYIRFKFQTLSKEFRFKTYLVNNIPILSPKKIEKSIFSQIDLLSRRLFDDHSIELEKELNLVIKDLYGFNEKEYQYILETIERYHNIILL